MKRKLTLTITYELPNFPRDTPGWLRRANEQLVLNVLRQRVNELEAEGGRFQVRVQVDGPEDVL